MGKKAYNKTKSQKCAWGYVRKKFLSGNKLAT